MSGESQVKDATTMTNCLDLDKLITETKDKLELVLKRMKELDAELVSLEKEETELSEQLAVYMKNRKSALAMHEVVRIIREVEPENDDNALMIAFLAVELHRRLGKSGVQHLCKNADTIDWRSVLIEALAINEDETKIVEKLLKTLSYDAQPEAAASDNNFTDNAGNNECPLGSSTTEEEEEI